MEVQNKNIDLCFTDEILKDSIINIFYRLNYFLVIKILNCRWNKNIW